MDLKTKYLGMTLRSPIVVSASPLSEYIQNIKMMEDAGAGAVVLHSLFEEQIRLEQQELTLSYYPGNRKFCGIAVVFSRNRRNIN
jgi:dihydroorotate dehydrogenase (fumarate)